VKKSNPHLFQNFEEKVKAVFDIQNQLYREKKTMNKTEAEYLNTYLRGLDARYEAITFRLCNGHKYTPDFVVFDPLGKISECHEVKGSYALGSQQRARLAFDQCRIEFKGIAWVWATKKKEGWVIE